MRPRDMGRRLLAGLVSVLLVAGCAASASPSPGATVAATTSLPAAMPTVAPTVAATPAVQATPIPTIGQPADDGARIVGVATNPTDFPSSSARTKDITIDSPSVGTVIVRLLIPTQFDAQPSTRWPVLYLLADSQGDYRTWTDETNVATLTAPTNLLVAMPGIGGNGWYSDWWNGGQGGEPKWETFDLVELPQLLERNWHAGTTCAIAGASMGGFGAMSYAARHPGMFRAAASYSGVLDPLGGHAYLSSDINPNVWGDPVAQAAVWKAYDPTDIAAALKGTKLFVSYGNGELGPLDNGSSPYLDPVGSTERELAHESQTFVQHLAALKIPVTVDAYGNGTHAYAYFGRELQRSLPLILKALGQ